MNVVDKCSTLTVLASSPLEGEDNAARFLYFTKIDLAA